MSKKWRILAVVPFAVLAAMVPACNKDGGSGDQPYVAFVSNNAEEFWAIARKGTEAAARDLNVKVEFHTPAAGDVADQQRILADLQAKGVQAIAVSPNDSANQVAYYKALNKKLPIVAVDNDIPDADARRCYLGTDNVTAGRAVGKLMKQVWPEGGKFLITVGKLDAQNAQERERGVVVELAGGEDKCKAELEQLKARKYPVKFGPYTLVATETDDVSGPVCQRKCEDVIGNTPDLKCIVGLWAYNPPAMLRAVQSQIKKGTIKPGQIKLIGFDENDETLNGIKSDEILGTVVQDPYNFGYQSVKILAGLVKGETKVIDTIEVRGLKLKPTSQKQIYVPHRIINKDGKKQPTYMDELVEGVESFQKDLNGLKGK